MSSRASTSSIDRYVGTKIMAERRRQNLTQHELAQGSGISRESIAQIETGGQNITLSALFQIATALGVPVASLLPGGEA